MALVALFVALVAATLAAFAVYFLKKVYKRLFLLENPKLVPLPARFSPPPEQIQSVFLPEIEADVDAVGAWAIEEERAGRPVSAEQMMVQRRMWQEA